MHIFLKLLWVSIAIIIITGSLLPVENLPETSQQISDKIQHAFAYFCLGVTGVLAWKAFEIRILTVFVSFLIGIGIEFLQPLTGRHFEYADMGANLVGLVIAVLTAYIWLRHQKTT